MNENKEGFSHDMTGRVNFFVPLGKREFDVLNVFSSRFWDIATVTVLENQTLMITIDYTNALAVYKGEKAVLDDDGDGGDKGEKAGSDEDGDGGDSEAG